MKTKQEMDDETMMIDALRQDVCPDCGETEGFVDGPRGGAGRNIFCKHCRAGFNVAWPRHILFAHRIGKQQ